MTITNKGSFCVTTTLPLSVSKWTKCLFISQNENLILVDKGKIQNAFENVPTKETTVSVLHTETAISSARLFFIDFVKRREEINSLK